MAAPPSPAIAWFSGTLGPRYLIHTFGDHSESGSAMAISCDFTRLHFADFSRSGVAPQPYLHLDAVASINPELLVSRTLASRSYPAVMFDRSVTLTLPRSGPTTFGAAPDTSATALPTFPRPPLATGFTRGGTAVGTVARVAPATLLVVNAVRLRWEARRASDLAGLADSLKVSEGFGSWLSIVRDWLSVWTEVVRDPVHGHPTPRARIAIVEEPNAGTFSAGGAAPRFVMGGHGATGLELRAAFSAASAGYPLPLHDRLLAEALLQFHRGEYRLAVITACAAAEVVLTGIARDALGMSGRKKRDIDEIMKGVLGIAELYRLNAVQLAALGVSIGRINAELAGPRNRAAHAGEGLDGQTATRALRTTRDLLRIVPTPTPAQVLKACG